MPGGRGNVADQVEVNPAQVFGVIRGRGQCTFALAHRAASRRSIALASDLASLAAAAPGRDRPGQRLVVGCIARGRCHCPPWCQHDENDRGCELMAAFHFELPESELQHR